MKLVLFLFASLLALPFGASELQAAATVRIMAIENAFREGGGSVPVLLLREGETNSAFTVDCVFRDYTAKAGVDYHPGLITVLFSTNEALKTVSLPNPTIANSHVDRGIRIMLLSLTNATDGVEAIGPDGYAFVSDDEVPNIMDRTFHIERSTDFSHVTIIGEEPNRKTLIVPSTKIMRFMPDGARDSSFRPFSLPQDYSTVGGFPLANGNWVVWWTRANYNFEAGDIVMLRGDGSIDQDFRPGEWIQKFDGMSNPYLGPLAVQTNGQILVAIGFPPRSNAILRLSADGSRDQTFTPILDRNETIAIEVQTDGKILAARNGYDPLEFFVSRYQSDGTPDPSFHSPFGSGDSGQQLLLQADGKILVKGSFPSVFGDSSERAVRLLRDGALDQSFRPPFEFDNSTFEIFRLPHDQILVGYSDWREFHVLNGDGSLKEMIPLSGHHPTVLADGRLLMFVYSEPFSAVARFDISNVNRPGVEFLTECMDLSCVQGVTAEESADVLNVTVRRLGDSSIPLNLTWFTRDGTATAGEDFVGQTNSMTFAPFEMEKTLTVNLLEDDKVEPPTEEFTIVVIDSESNIKAQLPIWIYDFEGVAVFGTPKLQGWDDRTEIPISIPGGEDWIIEASSDLRTWSSEGVIFEKNGQFNPYQTAFDRDAAGVGARFYRAVRKK
jgi:uncharacterized delta-60 repeat protein